MPRGAISLGVFVLGDLDDVRTYGYKAERAAALIYAHFKKEFWDPFKRDAWKNYAQKLPQQYDL